MVFVSFIKYIIILLEKKNIIIDTHVIIRAHLTFFFF